MKLNRALLIGVAAFSFAASGCGDDTPTTPSTPSPSVAVAELFGGTLDSGGSSFYSFPVDGTSNVGLTLLSLSTSATGPALTTPLTIGLGTPAGTGCSLMASTQTAPGLAPHVARPLERGIYCVTIADTGALTQTTNFLVRILIVPSGVAFPTRDEQTETFATNLPAGGAVTRTFTVTQPGAIKLTLQSASPADAVVGLAVGFWRTDGTGCNLTQSRSTPAGGSPQISLQADPGIYCVKVFDLGTLRDPVGFSLQIVHP